MDEQWSGSLHIGLTTLSPPELPSCPLSGLSPSLPHLRTKVTWLLSGSEVRRNGVLQRQNYGCSLDRLTVSYDLCSLNINACQVYSPHKCHGLNHRLEVKSKWFDPWELFVLYLQPVTQLL